MFLEVRRSRVAVVRVLAFSLSLAMLLGLSGCNVWRTVFPSNHHDSEAPALPENLDRPAILVFSKTNGFRHHEAIDAGRPALEAIAEKRGWGHYATENGAIHNASDLARFDVVVWFQASGNVLDESQRSALQEWIEAGGSFFGIHGAGGDPEYDWAWQPETLIGAQFTAHPMDPQFQEATIRIEARDHPAMRHLGETWIRTDEWYSFEKSPRGAGTQILATLDESTYSPRMKMLMMDEDVSMGADHPIIWTHCIGRGTSLYSALGHQAEAYSEPDHLTFLEEAMAWLVEARRRACSTR